MTLSWLVFCKALAITAFLRNHASFRRCHSIYYHGHKRNFIKYIIRYQPHRLPKFLKIQYYSQKDPHTFSGQSPFHSTVYIPYLVLKGVEVCFQLKHQNLAVSFNIHFFDVIIYYHISSESFKSVNVAHNASCLTGFPQ